MKNVDQNQEEIDLTKTLLFILLTLVLTLMIASMLIIPDIQQLKVSKIHATRSMKMLKNTRDYHDQVSRTNKELQEKNRKIIEALQVTFKDARVQKFGAEKLGRFDVSQSNLVPHDQYFVRHELNVSTRVESPAALYDFIDTLNNYESLTEMGFPLEIIANEDYSLDIRFNINVYELSSK
jgi:hypothetical protein